MDLQLDERYEVLAVGSPRRVYVVFTSQVFPLWTQLLRYVLRRRQGYPVMYTHALLIVADLIEEFVTVYEMDWHEGCSVSSYDYDVLNYNDDTHKLELITTAFNGATASTVFNAVDVTTLTCGQDIEYNYHCAHTDYKISPWTLMQHLRDTTDKLTWTCTGFVQALIGMPKYEAFINPLTPDQLWLKIVTTPQD